MFPAVYSADGNPSAGTITTNDPGLDNHAVIAASDLDCGDLAYPSVRLRCYKVGGPAALELHISRRDLAPQTARLEIVLLTARVTIPHFAAEPLHYSLKPQPILQYGGP